MIQNEAPSSISADEGTLTFLLSEIQISSQFFVISSQSVSFNFASHFVFSLELITVN
jgi:hypothetical protein